MLTIRENLTTVGDILMKDALSPAMIQDAVVGFLRGREDYRDLFHLLMTFPELKTEQGPVHERLVANHVEPEVYDLWREWVHKEFEPEDEDAEFDW